MKEVGIAELRTTKTAKIFGAIGRSGLVSGCCARAAALPRPPLPGMAGGSTERAAAHGTGLDCPRLRAHVSLSPAPESISSFDPSAEPERLGLGPGLELDG